MKDKIMRLLINVLVLSNPIGRAIWEEAASYNRGILQSWHRICNGKRSDGQ